MPVFRRVVLLLIAVSVAVVSGHCSEAQSKKKKKRPRPNPAFAKVTDEDSRTMSLINLIRLAKEDPSQFVPNLSQSDLEEMEDQISAHAGVLEPIKAQERSEISASRRQSRPRPAHDKRRS